MNLSEKKCIPCEGGIPPLEIQTVKNLLSQVSPGWKLEDEKKISREFFFVNYRHTIEFVNKIADVAESEGHHPVLHVYYGRILIELWTHAIDGLSENDFILASKIDKI
jgi:4a-hydroxytetrahydrobiopterin dehydratase